jgi:hypothetical protein
MHVFVVDRNGTPLLPTTPKRARKLLDSKVASVHTVVPFTIQLDRVVSNPVGSFEVGVDDGAKYVGVAVKNTQTGQVVFQGEILHRQDVKRKMKQRSEYRRSRRSRKLRYRTPRFCNRIREKLPTSIRQRKEAVVRVIKDLSKRLPLVGVIVEEVKFNHFDYSYGKLFSLVEIGKKFLREEIMSLGLTYGATYGFNTKFSRVSLGLSKTHSNDACAILNTDKVCDVNYKIKPRRSKVWEYNPTKTCEEKNGFRHFDLVKSAHKRLGFVVGTVRSLKANCITLRTKFNDNFPVSYIKTRLLCRPRGLIYY